MTSIPLLLALLSVAANADPAKGTLCVLEKNDQRCSSMEGTTLAVSASGAARPFVWSSADGTRALVSVIPPDASGVTIEEKGLARVTLAIDGDRRRGWPATARVTLTGAGREWAFPVEAKTVGKLRTIHLPAGSYQMSIAADHHITANRKFDAAENVTLGPIVLEPLPVISGRVLTTKDEPIAGAQIVRTDGSVQTVTDEQGQFRTELAEPLPEEVTVAQEHFASRLIPLSNARGDLDLGIIRLSTGRKLTLRLLSPDDEPMPPLRVRLMRESADKYEPTTVSQRDVPENEREISFPELSAGTYVVLLEGTDPLERMSTRVEIKDANAEEKIDIAPFRLDGSVRVGEEPLRGGTIELQDTARSWRASVPIDEGGRFGGTMWQRGKIIGSVRSAQIHEFVRSPDLGSDPSVWEITFKSRYIRGRIFDADTRQSVAQPSLRLQITSGETRSNSSLTVQPDGSYSILAVKPGTYELRVESPGHVPAKATVQITAEDAGDRQVDFPLSRGVEHVVEFVWPWGAAVAGATVLEGVASDGYNPERTYTTDGAGRLPLSLARREIKTLYVLPREGSFGVVRVVAPEQTDAAPSRLVVPAPGAALRVEMRDAEDKITPAMLLLRFNGELIPPPVILRLTGQFESVPTLHVRNLPAGAYELWGVTLPPYQQAMLVGRVPRRAPLRIGLAAGEQLVKLLAAPLD